MPWRRLLALALGISLLYSYSLYGERTRLLHLLENNHRRSYQELAWHIDGLEDQLATALIARTPGQQVRALTGIWRHAVAAQAQLNQLPLSPRPLENIQKLLHQAGHYALQLAVDVAGGESLDGQGELLDLWQRATYTNEQVQKMSRHLFASPYSLAKLERILPADAHGPLAADDNLPPLAKEFFMLEDGLGRLPEPTFATTTPRPAMMEPPGEKLTEGEIINAAREFLGPKRAERLEVLGTTRGEVPTYKVEMRGTRERIVLELTQRAGQVVWMLSDQTAGARKLSLDEGMKRAVDFLALQGLKDMIPTFRSERGNQGTYVFVAREGETYISPRQVKLRVSLTNGEITAYEASGLFLAREEVGEPALSRQEAAERLHPQFAVEDSRLVVTVNNDWQQILAYEFVGRLYDAPYTLYINAQDGREERIVYGPLEGGLERL
ncbi:MAG: PepSY1/2 domain-containing protein [Limnochordia bacterium]|jgi:spore germination protein